MTTTKECEELYTSTDKWKVTILAGCLFLLISFAYPFTAKMAQSIGVQLRSSNGCPNSLGVILHAVVFAVVVRLLMY